MKSNEEAMLKALVAIAWADGKLETEESEIVESLIDRLGVDDEGAETIRIYAKTPRTLDDVPVAELGPEDRLTLFRHAVILTHIDSSGQDDAERALLQAVAAKLGIPVDQVETLRVAAEAEAKELLDL